MSEASMQRPAPAQTVETRPFWEAANRGELLYGHCTACGQVHYYPRKHCPHCFSTQVEWRRSSGKGVVHSYSIVANRDQPYVLAYVTIEEGVAIFTNIVASPLDAIKIDASVEVVFEAAADGQNVPVFKLV